MLGLRVLIFHAFFDAGGALKFTLDLSKALEELGHDVEIHTFCDDRESIESYLALLTPNYRPKVITKPLPLGHVLIDSILKGRFTRLKRLVLARKFLKQVGWMRYEYDLLIDTSSNIPTDVDISYIHFPAVIPTYGSGLMNKLYNELVKWYAKRIEGRPRIMFVNSSWTANKVLSCYAELVDRVAVLHPPADVEYFSEVAGNDVRENLVVTISRFTPEKRLEEVLNVAKAMGDYRFVIVGSTSKYSQSIIKRLKSTIELAGLDNVELRINISRSRLRELLGSAKYYLHPPFIEHFGIAIAEAMAAGCIPIVYRDGGTWTDLVSPIDYRLGYVSINEVPKIIREIDGSVRVLRKKVVSEALKHSFSNFKMGIQSYVEKLR